MSDESDCSIKSHDIFHNFTYTMPFDKVFKYKRRKTLEEILTEKFKGYKLKRKPTLHDRKIRALYGKRITLDFKKI